MCPAIREQGRIVSAVRITGPDQNAAFDRSRAAAYIPLGISRRLRPQFAGSNYSRTHCALIVRRLGCSTI